MEPAGFQGSEITFPPTVTKSCSGKSTMDEANVSSPLLLRLCLINSRRSAAATIMLRQIMFCDLHCQHLLINRHFVSSFDLLVEYLLLTKPGYNSAWMSCRIAYPGSPKACLAGASPRCGRVFASLTSRNSPARRIHTARQLSPRRTISRFALMSSNQMAL